MPFGPKLLKPIIENLSTLRPIPEADGYFINESGEVFCIRKMSTYRCRDDYERVCIRSNGKSYRKAVHTLLAKVFLKPPKPGQDEVRHLDGNPTNNNLSNLAWGTRAENAQDMADHGTVKGEKNPRAILNEDQAREIIRSQSRTGLVESLAVKFGVSKSAIKAIREGRNWSHVK